MPQCSKRHHLVGKGLKGGLLVVPSLVAMLTPLVLNTYTVPALGVITAATWTIG